MRVLPALAASVAAVVIALGFVLADTERRQAGTNYVPEDDEVVTLRGTDEHCERGQVVPKDTAALRLAVGTFGRLSPPMAVSIRGGGTELSSGRLPAGGGEGPQPAGDDAGHLVIPLQRIERTTRDATVCVRASAAGDRNTVLYGRAGKVRFEWLRAGSESWLELVPTLVHRFALAKASPVGKLLLGLTALVLLLAWAAAVRILVRELRS